MHFYLISVDSFSIGCFNRRILSCTQTTINEHSATSSSQHSSYSNSVSYIDLIESWFFAKHRTAHSVQVLLVHWTLKMFRFFHLLFRFFFALLLFLFYVEKAASSPHSFALCFISSEVLSMDRNAIISSISYRILFDALVDDLRNKENHVLVSIYENESGELNAM